MAYKGRKRKRYGRRNAGKRSYGGFVLPVLAILTIPVAVLVAVTVFFKVGSITVKGESGYPDEDIIEASGIQIGENMFRFNKFKAKDGIFEKMPYIDEIIIRRRLPDKIEISVTRCEPVAAVQHGNEWYLMDLKGKLVERTVYAPPSGYVAITGMEMIDPKVGSYAVFSDEEKEKPLFLVLNTCEKNDIIPYIGSIAMEKLYSIKLTYKGRFTVNLGSIDQIEKKIRYMLIIAEEKLLESDRGVIDVSDGTTARFIP